MRIEPDSTITLYRDIPIDNGEQLVFASKNNQNAYFQSKIVRQYVPCTMIRKTGILRVEISGEVISHCNYLSFINPSFDNKIVYARIVDYDYVNNECTDISYAIDYWQTWMFDVSFENMYIDREHLSQADHEKAEANPYDPTIFELKTNEDLAIGKDLEKQLYEIGVDADHGDGYKLQDAVSYLTSVPDSVGVLVKLSNIDLENLDGDLTSTARPSYTLARLLAQLAGSANGTLYPDDQTSLGYYYLTSEMGKYLNQEYPTLIVNNYKVNGGWKLEGNTALPFYSTRYQPGCCFIYYPDGGSWTNKNGGLGDFLNWLSTAGQLDALIDILVIPNRLMFFSARNNYGQLIEARQYTARSAVEHHKLLRFPFSYLRVIAPNGDIKEFHYERFSSAINGNGYCGFSVVMDITDRPTLILAPLGYKYSGMSQSLTDTNILESILFNQFPTMPYSIDTFTAQVAAVANETIANKTVENAADMAAMDTTTNRTAQRIAVLQNAIGGIDGATKGIENLSIERYPLQDNAINVSGIEYGSVGGAVGLAKSVGNAASMYGNGAQMDMNRRKFEAKSARWQDATSALAGADGNAIASQLALTKPAYATDKYYRSDGIGTINFNQISFCDLIILRVSLNDDILAIYDNYFSHYGYKSGRCGIPRVINYSRGASDNAQLPHWETVNGKTTTYIKTIDCHVIYSMLPVASYIKNMFDSGVRMIKGDL